MGENLGQHFLDDEDVLADIITAGDISADDTILEIGPGQGVLTKKLAERADRVVAVEKDPSLVNKLQKKFKEEIAAGEITVIESDIRDLSLTNLVRGQSYKVIANIPYYLTGQLIKETLSSQHQPSSIVFLIQKEVAERIVAVDGKESILSLSVKSYGDPEIIRHVSSESFTPPPEVDSSILKINHINREFFSDVAEDYFFSLIKRGFGQKRKKLTNNLDTDPRFSKEQAEAALKKCNLSTNIRAEKLSVHDWKCLTKALI